SYVFISFLLILSDNSFFFFQAEDGIRDRNVTGVQTCALPISYQTWKELVPLFQFQLLYLPVRPVQATVYFVAAFSRHYSLPHFHLYLAHHLLPSSERAFQKDFLPVFVFSFPEQASELFFY